MTLLEPFRHFSRKADDSSGHLCISFPNFNLIPLLEKKRKKLFAAQIG